MGAFFIWKLSKILIDMAFKWQCHTLVLKALSINREVASQSVGAGS